MTEGNDLPAVTGEVGYLTERETSELVEYSSDELAMIQEQLMDPDATDDEFRLFLYVAQHTQLDPLRRQIYAIHRFDKRAGRKVMTIQTGIDGFRLIAHRSRQMDGTDGPYWAGEDGQWMDFWPGNGVPHAAKIIVYRKGHSHPYTGIAHFSEYQAQGPMWGRMPANQLAKCAEALALRKAFPGDLGGLYASEEMDQADRVLASDSADIQRDASIQIPRSDTDENGVRRAKASANYTCMICEKDGLFGDDVAWLQPSSTRTGRTAHWQCYQDKLADPPAVGEEPQDDAEESGEFATDMFTDDEEGTDEDS